MTAYVNDTTALADRIASAGRSADDQFNVGWLTRGDRDTIVAALRAYRALPHANEAPFDKSWADMVDRVLALPENRDGNDAVSVMARASWAHSKTWPACDLSDQEHSDLIRSDIAAMVAALRAAGFELSRRDVDQPTSAMGEKR
jgi:hypothetical protein